MGSSQVDFEDLVRAFGRLVDDSGNAEGQGEAEITHEFDPTAERWSRNNTNPRDFKPSTSPI